MTTWGKFDIADHLGTEEKRRARGRRPARRAVCHRGRCACAGHDRGLAGHRPIAREPVPLALRQERGAFQHHRESRRRARLPDRDRPEGGGLGKRGPLGERHFLFERGILGSCKKPGISQNEIVEEVGLEKSVVAKTIGKLMDMEFLTRTQNAKDKRAFDVFPTEKAQEIYPVLVSQGTACMELLTADFSEDEKALLSALLERMVENTKTRFYAQNEK